MKLYIIDIIIEIFFLLINLLYICKKLIYSKLLFKSIYLSKLKKIKNVKRFIRMSIL